MSDLLVCLLSFIFILWVLSIVSLGLGMSANVRLGLMVRVLRYEWAFGRVGIMWYVSGSSF